MLRPLVITTKAAALLRATQNRSLRLSCYVAVELTESLIYWRLEKRYGWQSPQYFWATVALDFVLFAAIFAVARVTVWGWLAAVLAAYAGFLASDSAVDHASILLLAEGFFYVLAGVSTGARQPVLAALWIALGLFSLGYVAGGWFSMDPWWQSIVCIVGFGLLAMIPRDLEERA